jgi:hypothetical protein
VIQESDLEKCAQEVNEMQDLSPASVEVSRLGAFAMITLIQAAVQQQPEIADDEWAKIGIAAARQLQKDLFNEDSEAHKMLEFCWNPEAYIVTPSVIAGMLQDIHLRRSEKHKSSEQDGGCDETLAQQISRKILESQGYLDM